MGSDRHYPEEAPVQTQSVEGFWLEKTLVTNTAFAKFVAATGYVTFAEKAPNAQDYPGADPALLQAGSLVFVPPKHNHFVNFSDVSNWWQFVIGANWQHPQGAASNLDGLSTHPVVHIAYEDALAYAMWAKKSLPTEAEWEYAAKGGLENTEFAWGHDFNPKGQRMANTWHGEFPSENLAVGGFAGTSAVAHFEQNGYGLYDMIGNVWEWTCDWYSLRRADTNDSAAVSACCAADTEQKLIAASIDANLPEMPVPRRVLKGGSFLCAPNYCRRYRPAARIPQPIDTTTNHVGFRCVVRGAQQRVHEVTVSVPS